MPPPSAHAGPRALPVLLAYLLVPLGLAATLEGGLLAVLFPIVAWGGFALRDEMGRHDHGAAEPEETTSAAHAAALVWAPVQLLLLFWLLWYLSQAQHLNLLEQVLIGAGAGVVSGTVGYAVAHDLIHRRAEFDRFLGDVLLAMILLSHLRSEHLLRHHRHVATPLDAGTARPGESFHRFAPRALRDSARAALHAEAQRGADGTDTPRPFWRYAFLQLVMLMLAMAVGGWAGLGLFLLEAVVAILCVLLGNYLDHYGLTRRPLEGGGFEPVRPHHGWTAGASWLPFAGRPQPSRRLPLLRPSAETEPAELPHAYPVMAIVALVPAWWHRLMSPQVAQWRQVYYPEIPDWRPHEADARG